MSFFKVFVVHEPTLFHIELLTTSFPEKDIPNFHKFLFNQVFEGKRHSVQPQNGIPGFSLHFPKEPSYGYLRFVGNGKIPLGK